MGMQLHDIFFKFTFLREREQVGERQREREKEIIPSRLCTISVGLELTNHEIIA